MTLIMDYDGLNRWKRDIEWRVERMETDDGELPATGSTFLTEAFCI